MQQYSQPISYGITSYELKQWMSVAFVQDQFRVNDQLTLDAGLRYDRQTLTDATSNFAPRLGFAWHPGDDARLVIRGGYAMYYTQIRANALASALTGGLDGIVTYTATPGQTGFPTCLTGPCLPVPLDPRALPLSQQPARNITVRAGRRDFYKAQFATYGLNFDLLPNYPDEFVNPRSQVTSIGAEREIVHGLFAGADYVHQHWTDLDRTVDLNAPTPFDRTAPGQTRSVAAANATRPIVPVNGGVRNVNVLMNLGIADYDGLQTQISYRGSRKLQAALSYTLSKATNTTEPDGNGIGSNDANIARLGEEERGPSVVDQRHRAVITASYALPYNITAGTLMQFASARPFNAVTGIDNNGDGANNDRPVVDGDGHRQVGVPRHRHSGRGTLRRGPHQDRTAIDSAEDGGIQPVQPREHPRPGPDDLWRHGDGEFDVRAGRRGGDGNQRAPVAGEHRPAADVPVSGEVYVLEARAVARGCRAIGLRFLVWAGDSLVNNTLAERMSRDLVPEFAVVLSRRDGPSGPSRRGLKTPPYASTSELWD